jgi:hypothetical protein
MKRRELISLLVSAAAVWPFAARAQQPAMPIIRFLGTASPGPFAQLDAGFRQGLQEACFVEGWNLLFTAVRESASWHIAHVRDSCRFCPLSGKSRLSLLI